jgi:hypothetical protein
MSEDPNTTECKTPPPARFVEMSIEQQEEWLVYAMREWLVTDFVTLAESERFYRRLKITANRKKVEAGTLYAQLLVRVRIMDKQDALAKE